MRFVLFYHSLISDWNHGNAHFLRGIVRELSKRGHDVRVYEPEDGWSLASLKADHGERTLGEFAAAFPDLTPRFHRPDDDLDELVRNADAVIVHEWNDPTLIARLGELKSREAPFRLFFHDTHHRAAGAPEEIKRFDLSGYDGVLAYGRVIRDLYVKNGWTKLAWTWHEAADTSHFFPRRADAKDGDLVWVGNWGDDERTAEMHEFLIEPVARLGLRAKVHGVRYPDEGRQALKDAGIEYGGWLANHRVPETFAKYRVTVHVPRRPYVKVLPGIPTIRVFEALACGVPLISAPWNDAESLFTPGRDYLVARNGAEMQNQLRRVLDDPVLASSLAEHGLATIRKRHTCAHRVDELLAILEELDQPTRSRRAAG
ncbi:MAG: glycosyltransferase [Planctomycetaceae bacterium]|nr:glycosyltransferase [Planctomycetaceae bacterium]